MEPAFGTFPDSCADSQDPGLIKKIRDLPVKNGAAPDSPPSRPPSPSSQTGQTKDNGSKSPLTISGSGKAAPVGADRHAPPEGSGGGRLDGPASGEKGSSRPIEGPGSSRQGDGGVLSQPQGGRKRGRGRQGGGWKQRWKRKQGGRTGVPRPQENAPPPRTPPAP